MSVEPGLQARLEKLYGALSSGDIATWASMHTADVAFNVNGSTAVSGRTVGRRKVVEELLPLLFSRVQPDTAAFGVGWKCMVADERRAAVIFEGRSRTLEDAEYNNRYLQLLEFDDAGLIREVWEFFDTALAEQVLFTADQAPPPDTGGFRY